MTALLLAMTALTMSAQARLERVAVAVLLGVAGCCSTGFDAERRSSLCCKRQKRNRISSSSSAVYRQSPNLTADRAFAFAASSSRFRGGAVVSKARSSFKEAPVI